MTTPREIPVKPVDPEVARAVKMGELVERLACHAELLKEEWDQNASLAIRSLSEIESLTGQITRLVFSRTK